MLHTFAPVYERDLYKLTRAGWIEMQESDEGFNLTVVTEKGPNFLLHTQRGQPRVFKSLDKALSLIWRYREGFTVRKKYEDLF